MQTFLPYTDYLQCAVVLDNKRLGKQRVESWQIVKALSDPRYGWQHHPAVKMWRNYEWQLIQYTYAIIDEWTHNRGFHDTVRDQIAQHQALFQFPPCNVPPWLDERVCLSHQSNLLRKDPFHYTKYFPSVPNNIPYHWPI